MIITYKGNPNLLQRLKTRQNRSVREENFNDSERIKSLKWTEELCEKILQEYLSFPREHYESGMGIKDFLQ